MPEDPVKADLLDDAETMITLDDELALTEEKADLVEEGLPGTDGPEKNIHQSDIDRNVAPPGMEDVVKRLKTKEGVDNPFALAWSMHDKQSEKNGIDDPRVTYFGPRKDAFAKNLQALEYIASGVAQAPSSNVVQQLYSDALSNLSVNYREDPVSGLNFYSLWKFVLDSARGDADKIVEAKAPDKSRAGSVTRFSMPHVRRDGTERYQAEEARPVTKFSDADPEGRLLAVKKDLRRDEDPDFYDRVKAAAKALEDTIDIPLLLWPDKLQFAHDDLSRWLDGSEWPDREEIETTVDKAEKTAEAMKKESFVDQNMLQQYADENYGEHAEDDDDEDKSKEDEDD